MAKAPAVLAPAQGPTYRATGWHLRDLAVTVESADYWGDALTTEDVQVRAASATRSLKLPQRFARSVSLNALAAAVTGIAAIVLTPFLLHHLGVDAYGVWALAGSVVGYLELAELGFGAASTKLMAEDAGKRPRLVSETLSTSFAVLVALGLLGGGITVCLAIGAPHWFNIPRGLEASSTAVFLALGISLSVSIPGDTFGGALAAYQRYDLRSLSNLLLVAVTTVLTVAAVEAGGTLIAVAVVTATVSIAMHPIRRLMLYRVDPDVHISRKFVSRTRLGVVAKFSGWMMLAQMTGAISFGIDLVIIGAVLNIRDVALYAIGSKLGQLAQRALNEVSTVLLPEAASLAKEGEHEEVGNLLIDGTRLTMLVGIPFALVTGILARAAVRAWVGRGYDHAATVLAIFSLVAALWTVINPVEAVVIAAGNIRRFALSMTAQAVVNVTATVVLVSVIGLPGPALGTLAGTVLVIAPAFIVLGCSAAHCSLRRFFRGAVVPHLLPTAATAGALFGLRHSAEHGRVDALAIGALGVGMYAAIYYMFSAVPAERAAVAEMIRRRIINGHHYRRP